MWDGRPLIWDRNLKKMKKVTFWLFFSKNGGSKFVVKIPN
jgi:hypothetical protein